MPVRTAEAEWLGTLREGRGTMQFADYAGPYSFASRFAAGEGTNPEELIGAAHAGCFSMAFAGDLVAAGYEPERVHTTARVHIDNTGDHFTITAIDLETQARVPGISEEAFQRIARGAKAGCPVTRALAGVSITLTARLV